MSNGDRMLECPAHCVVQLRAYELWELRGRRFWDHPEKDWFAAEGEFESERKSLQDRRALFVRWRAKELWLLYARPVDRDRELWRKAEHHVDEYRQAFIARVAHGIWEKEGRPEGAAARHWAEAEREVAARLF